MSESLGGGGGGGGAIAPLAPLLCTALDASMVGFQHQPPIKDTLRRSAPKTFL